MDKYFMDMDGHEPKDLYDLILSQVEEPLFETVLDYTGGNVSKAAEVLGLNRGTLRNRLMKYDLQ
ncbi:MAG: helix-turn-helix domain-containing protein [Gammaproteobacteria bacterium]